MDLDYPQEDSMVLDIEKAPVGGVPVSVSTSGTGRERDRERDRDKNRSMLVSVVSTPESHAVTLNGFGGSPRNSTPSTMDDPSPALLRRVNQASREQSIQLSTNAKGPPGQLTVESSRKSHLSSEEDSSDDLALDKMSRRYKFPTGTLPTGLCYDVRMRYHCELDPPKQRLDFHPEDPRRIYSIYKEFCLAGLVDDEMSTRPIVSRPLSRVSARNATQAEICLVHDTKHFNFIERTKGNEVILHD